MPATRLVLQPNLAQVIERGVGRMLKISFTSRFTLACESQTLQLSTSQNGLKGMTFLRMHKTGKPLYTWIPDWLVARLRDREKVHGPRIFLAGVTQNAKQLCDIWRNKRLKKVFELAGPFEEKATPHRFRHTFVRILLEKGLPVGDVAELMGHRGDGSAPLCEMDEIQAGQIDKHFEGSIRGPAKPRVVPARRENKGKPGDVPKPKVVSIHRHKL